jgi:hypothetical protein
VDTLLLQARDVADKDTWRWLLTDSDSGAFVADYQVVLKPTTAEYQAFTDLLDYLKWNADPGRRATSEALLLNRLGDWLGTNLLGAVGQAMMHRAPAAVRVIYPANLRFLLHRPLALARVDGIPLAEHVSLIFDTSEYTRQPPKSPVAERPRMLAVFGLPTDASAVPLRRERHELSRVVRDISGVELRILQYGVTRERLESMMEEGTGWDVLHLAGHGIAAGDGLALEGPDGGTDVLMAEELARLLRRGRSQLKLVVISQCKSSAAALAERRRRLGFESAPLEYESSQGPARQSSSAAVSELASTLANRLDCAVVAMRYPSAEDTTVQFNSGLYRGLFAQRQNVATALRSALADIEDSDPSSRLLAMASPILVGGPLAVDLSVAPRGRRRSTAGEPTRREAGFPAESDRFVGRNETMAQASAALAPASGRTGVLFHGLVGAGKTACALELAHRNADSFWRMVWWQAPASKDAVAVAFTSLRQALDRQFGETSFGAPSDDERGVRQFLIGLSTLLEELPVLLVLDGLDTLLSADGQWRDDRWHMLTDTLMTHRGRSRVILTCRTRPAFHDQAKLLAVPVHTLSLDETIMLAQELPTLRALAHAEPDLSPIRSAARVNEDRTLLRRLLKLVQGHPQMLELADAAAADSARLAANLDAADQEGKLRAVFVHGSGPSRLRASEFLEDLSAWTERTVAGLPSASSLLLQLLCYLEEPDRTIRVVEDNWADLWRRLGSEGGPPPAVTAYDARRLVVLTLAAQEDAVSPFGTSTGLRVDPGVAESVRAIARDGVGDAVAEELADFWTSRFESARAGRGRQSGQAVVHAGLAAAPYLNRCANWSRLGVMLRQVVARDSSPGVLQAALRFTPQVARTTNLPEDIGLLGRTLTYTDPARAEQLMRGALDLAKAEQNFLAASAVAGDLASLLRDTGRLHEALQVTEEVAVFASQADPGTWAQIANEARRLEMLSLSGQNKRVLAKIGPLLDRMAQLPDETGPDEAIAPWNVREFALGVGCAAATALGRWEQALDLNAQLLASRQGRGAGRYEIASARFNDYGPLLHLGRLDEAESKLRNCQVAFADEGDILGIARVFGARAALEQQRDQVALAADLQRTALRLLYAQPDPRDIAASHYNFAGYLSRLGADAGDVLAHLLAAALIYRLIDLADAVDRALVRLAADIRRLDGEPEVPATVEELTARVDQVEGVHLASLVASLSSDPERPRVALADLLAAVQSQPDQAQASMHHLLDDWSPRIAAIVAAVDGDERAKAEITRSLDELAGSPGCSELTGRLRRVLAGDRDRKSLSEGLDEIDTVIVDRTLDAVADRLQLRPPVDPRWSPVIDAVAAAARGDEHVPPGLDQLLDQLAETSDWSALAAVLRRILAGERDPDRLTAGVDALDAVDTAIVEEVLTLLAGQHPEQLEEWRSRRIADWSERTTDEIM